MLKGFWVMAYGLWFRALGLGFRVLVGRVTLGNPGDINPLSKIRSKGTKGKAAGFSEGPSCISHGAL